LACVPGLPNCSPPTVDIAAGGVADGEALPLGVGSAAWAAGASAGENSDVNERDTARAEVTGRERLAVFLEAGTIEKVHGSAR
jgi:hypothetical protein